MISPSYDYDRGRITLTFPASPEPFASSVDAERYLKDRGFSVGYRQGSDPRGILFGDVRIQKWRNLNAIEREALHGVMSGDGRNSPVRITIFADAPVEVRRAIVAIPTTAEDRSFDRTTRALGVATDIVALAAIIFCLGAVGWVSLHPIWSRAPLPGKFVLRVDAVPTIEARR